jgi:uncharacterized membrane protein YsdA (DUF1294 family)/cold shock CspA family protein
MFSAQSKIQLQSVLIGKIVEWDDRKGYGFIQLGATTVFLHRREFAFFHKRPALGDSVKFSIGLDVKGRTCAKSAEHMNDGGKFSFTSLCALVCLLVLPVLAVIRAALNPLYCAGYFVAINALAYALYAGDKQSARDRAWRTSENRLHLVELLGGWPAAFVAQRRLRHKTSKPGYQFVFCLIVLLYQFVAIDSLANWTFSKRAAQFLQHQTSSAPPAPR